MLLLRRGVRFRHQMVMVERSPAPLADTSADGVEALGQGHPGLEELPTSCSLQTHLQLTPQAIELFARQ